MRVADRVPLRDLQRSLRAALLAGSPADPAVTAAAALVRGDAARIGIYRGAVLGTLVGALGNIYPVCRRLTGEEFFDAMAACYARSCTSRSPDLADYGEAFAAFTADFEPAGELPYLADTARLEWLWHRAFNGPEDTPLAAGELAGVSEADMPRVVFRLPLSGALLRSGWPVAAIWEANQPDVADPPRIDLDDGGVRLIVWRNDAAVRIDKLSPDEWQLVSAVAARQPLGLLAELPIGDKLPSLLPHCVARGWISGFNVAAESAGALPCHPPN